MSRSHRRARWATCALLLLSVSTAAAQPKKAPRKKKVSVTQCTRFDQKDREDDGVDLVIDNQCEVKLACSVHWKVMCSPGTPLSSEVGMSGMVGERRGHRFAIALIAPDRTCGSETAACATKRSTCPDSRSVMAGPPPR